MSDTSTERNGVEARRLSVGIQYEPHSTSEQDERNVGMTQVEVEENCLHARG